MSSHTAVDHSTTDSESHISTESASSRDTSLEPPEPPPRPDASLRPAPWAALQHRDYRLFAIGQLVALIGLTMQNSAINWQLWNLTHDTWSLGLISLCRVLPVLLLALYGGAISDTFDRRRIFAIGQIAMLIFSGVLALATLSGFDHSHTWIIYVMTALMAGTTAISTPAANALLPRLVSKKHLTSALSLDTIFFQVAAVIGPIVAGELIAAHSGLALSYGLNVIGFLFALFAVLLIHPSKGAVENPQPANGQAIREGVHFVRSTPLLWSTMLLDFMATFLASALALLPIYADQILHVGAQGYGLLVAAPAIGSMVAALVMGHFGSRINRPGTVILITVAIYGLATVAFGFSQVLWLALIALALIGMADSVGLSLRQLVRQVITPDRLRGRTVSINMIFDIGGPQLGEVKAGLLAALTGTSLSVIAGGALAVIAVGAMVLMVPALSSFRWSESEHHLLIGSHAV